ncbi:hypothetical protein MKW94_015775, partial [Papaver nudicaule]|nr:hypothetical protein [Papaver nudicaule]
KELEKMGPKKGVISQSVKDVIQSLVDDDLVLKDKIGSYVYFCSLPSCATELIARKDALKKGRKSSDERAQALVDLETVEIKYNELKNEMGNFADNDSVALEAMNVTVVSHAASNRWTDNIFAIKQWCSNNIPHAKEQLEHVYDEVILPQL